MATHSGSLSSETVGFLPGGKILMISPSLFLGALSISPTLPFAAMAPCSINTRRSTLLRFHLSSLAVLFIMKRVVDSINVSTILKLFALREDPVSVTSTMASTSLGALTSVAPQENSTLAVTPCPFNQSVVRLTTSVAILFPCRSFALCIEESLGTARTHRTGLAETFE